MVRRIILLLCCGAWLTASPAWADKVFMWTQGQPKLDLGSAASQFCFLTRVQGRFSGHGEIVRLRVINGRWQLGGESQQNDVGAWARCMDRNEWGKPTDTKISSEEISLRADKSGPIVCQGIKKKAWWGDAITHVTLLGGRLRGKGENVLVIQSESPFASSMLWVNSCQTDTQMDGAVYSFFVGKPQSGSQPIFVGPSGTGTASQAGDYASDTNQDVLLAPTENTTCFFTQLGGDFRGGGESLTILPGSDANGVSRWVLQARHGSGSGTFARARCVRMR